MTPIVLIEADWKERGRGSKYRGGFSPTTCSFVVFFLPLPVTPEVKWHVSRVLVSSTHYPLVF